MSLSRRSTVLFLVLSQIHLVLCICYYPDGKTVALQDTPCLNQTIGWSHCCPQGYACMSNMLCKLTSYVVDPPPDAANYSRASCTNKDFQGPWCQNFCLRQDDGDMIDRAMPLVKCEENENDQYYCVNQRARSPVEEKGEWNSSLVSSMLCTSNTAAVVFYGKPTTVTIIGVEKTFSRGEEITPTPSVPATSESSNLPDIKIAATIASSPSLPITSLPAGSTSQPSSSTLAITIGVAVPVAVLAIAVVTYLIWRYRKHQEPPHSKEDQVAKVPTPELGNGRPAPAELPPRYLRVELAGEVQRRELECSPSLRRPPNIMYELDGGLEKMI